MSEKKRYVQVGLGGRHMMFRDAVIEQFSEQCELVGLCDANEGRLKLSQSEVRESIGKDVPGYSADRFDEMIAEQHPQTVIVTTMDRTHDEYICRALELGCDVITEKPMTTDAGKCQRIIETQKKTGKKVTVSFNYRYSPTRTQIKELLMSGVIGEILSLDFHWLLNVHHGADYFRRWHRNKENSGGLMVHKATHHFDLVNWWLSDVPETVYASGHRNYYLPSTADRLGLVNRAERCRDCEETSRCPFYLNLDDEARNGRMHKLYLANEHYDGYFRDRCVFSDKIDIEDSMNLVVGYRGGAKMTYSLNAFCPSEGYNISFNGTKGRIEHKCQEKVYINSDGSVPGALVKEGTSTKIFPNWKPAYEVEIWTGTGGHGGGDKPLLVDLFDHDPPQDKYLRAADQRGGAWSILTGIAANKSMQTGSPVRVEDLVSGLEDPDYPPMPSTDAPIPIPDHQDVALSKGKKK
jgi:predicted dehydrogenase